MDASSMVDSPLVTTPSNGICSPGFTTTMVPTTTSSTGIVVPSNIRATLGDFLINAATARRERSTP